MARARQRVCTIIPRPLGRADAERIREDVAERVPVDDRKPQVFLERFAV